MKKAAPTEDLAERVLSLRQSLRFTIYVWVSRGLFECHKLTFLTQFTFELLKAGTIGDGTGFDAEALEFLLRCPKDHSATDNPIEWLPDSAWLSLNALSNVSGFEKLPADLVETASRFKDWCVSLVACG